MNENFDAIVVGAGPAGSACATVLARGGLRILLVERGKYPGSKNMWGGVFYGPQMKNIFPEFPEGAPVERAVTKRRITVLGSHSSVSIEFSNTSNKSHLTTGFTVLRSKFDKWFASKAEEAGAIVATELKASDVIKNNGKIEGIIAGGDEFRADVVVACDGVNSIITRKAGLVKDEPEAEDMKLGVKEVLKLDSGEIEKRFGLRENEGLAWEIIGIEEEIPGGGFIYTNHDTVSIGVVLSLNELGRSKKRPEEILEKFKNHTEIKHFIVNAEICEYSAHLIPTGGIKSMPNLYGNGILVAGDAASMVLSTGIILEGANFAVASGIAAGETIMEAHKKRDFSSSFLSLYQKKLENTFVLKDLRTFKKAPKHLKNPRLYNIYPKIICEVMEKIMQNDGSPRENTLKILKNSIRRHSSCFEVASDIIKIGRVI